MRIEVLEGNSQKLDGGAMFGNAPRAVWSGWSDVDSQNRIELATRGLYVEFDDGMKVVFETGVGAFFDPKLKFRYGVNESNHVLLESLAECGLSHEDIDAVVLSHLHFDHAGGLLTAWRENEPPSLLFPNARFLVSCQHWQRAQQPHPRDRASFINSITDLLKASGRLELVEDHEETILDGRIKIHFSDGHTPGLMLSEIATHQGPLVFCSDLIPGVPWVHVPITMGYDRFPEQLINEKLELLEDIYTRNGMLFFTHDPDVPCGRVGRSSKGRYVVTAVEVP
jgi:glyoxylase-like metal-dependent hydrolase (beta-lactamase superfamily II)